ncbi:MAG: RNA methyltransferase [Lachnospiraceae bacterium]|nr:RNA methyltransferase [Lachnospiraceae bacterium]
MNLIEIKDVDAPELEVFTKCSEPQLYRYFEPEMGIFLAESASVILRALEAGYEPLSILVETGRMEAEAAPVFEAVKTFWGEEKLESIPVYTAEKDIVTRLTGYALVRGLWMTMRRRKEPTMEEFCRGKKRIAVLYDVVNPANAGAIIRSAAALGMDGVLLSHASVDPLARRASRVSMGTVFQIPWAIATKEESEELNLIRLLHSYGFKTLAMALTEDSTNIDNDVIRANERLAVFLGSEGPGLPKDIIAACDYRVMIPMHYGVDSLNVAAASAISFWELMKQKDRYGSETEL